jgi:hypothetical protein
MEGASAVVRTVRKRLRAWLGWHQGRPEERFANDISMSDHPRPIRVAETADVGATTLLA